MEFRITVCIYVQMNVPGFSQSKLQSVPNLCPSFRLAGVRCFCCLHSSSLQCNSSLDVFLPDWRHPSCCSKRNAARHVGQELMWHVGCQPGHQGYLSGWRPTTMVKLFFFWEVGPRFVVSAKDTAHLMYTFKDLPKPLSV